ncbi:hypothetical protein H5410_039314 [Solanum commersonii]|uniref:Uncharacterized protein n=1 Tax=Solanum commersonii TaxID=4109 RepID=A0A9J5YD08_SOLCO|nr:hypothetical protein H5410_039314 [Solanum commersonii]
MHQHGDDQASHQGRAHQLAWLNKYKCAVATGLKSVATTLPELPKILAIPIASAPLPVPKSAHNPSLNSSFSLIASSTRSTISSVSGLGIKTPS